jgi:hypothetical protein
VIRVFMCVSKNKIGSQDRIIVEQFFQKRCLRLWLSVLFYIYSIANSFSIQELFGVYDYYRIQSCKLGDHCEAREQWR